MSNILRRVFINSLNTHFRYVASTVHSTKMATKTALALLANGSEEMELVITVDVLRRAGVSNMGCNEITICKSILTLAFCNAARFFYDYICIPYCVAQR